MTIFTMGDSTMQFNNIYRYPQTGWPQMLPLFLKPGINLENFGKMVEALKALLMKVDFLLC